MFCLADRDSDASEDEGEPAADDPASLAPQRSRYIIRSHRRRDRLVKDLDDALDLDKYDILPPVADGAEIRYEVPIAADKQWKTKARTVTWTNKEPHARRQPPENILRAKRRLSDQAQAAVTPKEHWLCFFTEEIRDLIVKHTNEKIADSIQEKKYSAERLQQSPYIKPVDRVRNFRKGS
jgi:hypothetical protein